MALTLKEAIQARKLKLIAKELESLARQDRSVKKIVDTLKKGREPKADDITSLKGDTQDEVVMAFASVIGPSKTSDFLGEAKTIKVGEDAVGAEKPHYVIVKDRKVIAKGDKEEMMEKCGDGERVWLSTKDVGDMVEDKGPCWDGYKQVGMKKNKKGKEVPNCVPEGKEDPDIGDRKGSQPASYHKGLAPSTKEKRDAQFKKQAEMSDDDPAAYKPAPGDKEAKTKESKYTKKYDKMFGEETLEESNTEKALRKKSEETGVAYGILKDVYDRGVAAWRTGHRPGTTPAQWGMARVNSFVTGGKTQKTADADLWKKHKGQNEEVDMSDHELTEAAIKASVVEKEIADMVGKQNVKMKLGHIEFKHKGKMHKIPVDRGYVKGTDYDDFLEMQESVELDEAVRVDDSRFKRTHKKAPKGKGLWGFTTKKMGDPKESETYMPALAMDYSKALEMGKKWAERQGSSVVYVLESVSKNTAFGYANRGRSTFKSMHKMVKQLVRADDDMVTNYLDSTHGRHLADAERDMSAAKLKAYIKKDFALFKRKYDPKSFRKQDDVRKMNQAERIRQRKIMKGYKFANPKPVREANEEDMQPASPDEKSMALKQADFIQYVGREIGEHLVANREFPEWMQNKLSALHQKAKDMHATLGAHGGEMDESVELDEAITADTKYGRAHDKAMELTDKANKSRKIDHYVDAIKAHKEALKHAKSSTNKSAHNGHIKVLSNKLSMANEEVEMSNYNYRTEAHSPMHVSKAVRIAEKMGGDMTGAVEKIEKMAKGLSDHPKVKAALRMANESVELTEKAKVSGYYQKNKEPRHKGKTDKNSSTEQLIHKYLEAADILDNEDFGSTPYDFASRDLDYLGSLLNKRGFSVGELNKMADKFSRDEKYPMIKEDFSLTEKAESEAQAIAARIALKHKREGTKPEAGTASAEMMKMSEKDLEDFTKVKKGAPEKVEEAVKFTHLVVDKDGKVKGAHTSEKDAKSMAFRIKGEVEKLKKPLSQKQVDDMKAMSESVELMESHFKVGDKVTCIESGMKGEVIKLDEPQVGKYYTVRREDGEVMKYASDELKKVMSEAMDDVDKAALKKKFKNRKDKDIDNDGDVDSSDEYLHKRRSAISKAIAKEQSEVKLKEKDVDKDGDADDLDKSLEKRKQKVLDTSE